MRMRRLMGTPDMKATSFLLDETRTPICHSLCHPGGFKALEGKTNIERRRYIQMQTRDIPFQELGRILEPEGGLVVLDVVR